MNDASIQRDSDTGLALIRVRSIDENGVDITSGRWFDVEIHFHKGDVMSGTSLEVVSNLRCIAREIERGAKGLRTMQGWTP